MSTEKTPLKDLIKNAYDIRDKQKALHDITLVTDYRVYFRPTTKGITAVSLRPETALGGQSYGSVKSFLKRWRAELDSKVLHKKKEAKKEHRLHAFLVRDALLHDGEMVCLAQASSESGQPFQSMRYVTDEISSPPNNIQMEGKSQRPICDILALRKCEGGDIPVLLELKYDRERKELRDQINDYTKILWKFTEAYEGLYSNMMPRAKMSSTE